MADRGMLIVTGDGREFSTIENFSLKSHYTRGPDEWNATVMTTDLQKRRYLELQPVDIYLDGVLQMQGRIEESEMGGQGLAFSISGRDFRGDLASCHIDPVFKIGKDEALDAAILRACSPCGITGVLSDGNWAQRSALSGSLAGSPPLKGFQAAKTDEFAPSPEEYIWTFIKRLVSRFGATIQAGSDRTQLVLAAPNYDQSPLYSLRRTISSQSNNVKWSSARRNYRDAPTYAMVAGKQWKQKGAQHGIVWSDGPVYLGRPGTINKRVKPGEDRPEGDLYRLFFRRSNDARNQSEVDLTFNRAIAERFNEILHYQAEIHEWADSVNGHIWTIDTMVNVDDEVADVNDKLWIASRELKYNNTTGPTTSVECWIPETFNLLEPGEFAHGGVANKALLIEVLTNHLLLQAEAIKIGYGYGSAIDVTDEAGSKFDGGAVVVMGAGANIPNLDVLNSIDQGTPRF